jgi:hypothetical protein
VLRGEPDDEVYGDPETNLTASAVSGQAPPAGPQWAVRLSPPQSKALAYDKPLCASKDGFTLHAATRAGALDISGREALLRYGLRPPIAQDKIEHRAAPPHREVRGRARGSERVEIMVRYLAGIGEPTQLPARSPDRGPPYWKSTILRRQALGYDDP